jgi:hypothetical protein
MHNQHAGLSQLLAHQHIQALQEQAAQARLADGEGRPRRRRHRWAARRWWQLARWPAVATSSQPHTHPGSVDREVSMSTRTRVLIIGATLATMTLVTMATVAHADQQPAGPEGIPRPPTERQVGEPWRQRQAASQDKAAQDQAAADATLQRVQARERFSIPSPTPSQVPASAPTRPSRPSGWLFASLGVLVATLGLAGGLAVRAARRTRRRARLEHAA